MSAEEEQPAWYVRRSTSIQGPYPASDIQRYLLLGRLRLSDRVSTDGRCWEPLTQRPELIPEEMRDLGTDEGRARFEAARRAVDERVVDRDTVASAGPATERGWRRWGALAVPAGLLVLVVVLVGIGWYRDFDHGLHRADCTMAPARDAVWSGCVKDGLQLARGSVLTGLRALNVSMRQAEMPAVDLSGARLDYADLTGARLSGADLSGAVLRGVSLNGADLRGVNLRRADLRNADLRDARIDNAILEGAMLGNALWTDGQSCAPEAVGTCDP